AAHASLPKNYNVNEPPSERRPTSAASSSRAALHLSCSGRERPLYNAPPDLRKHFSRSVDGAGPPRDIAKQLGAGKAAAPAARSFAPSGGRGILRAPNGRRGGMVQPRIALALGSGAGRG